MQTTGNTILITGGGTGIGRGLAEAFHALGNHVIIAGRRQQALDETTAANPGMQSVTLDAADPAKIRAFAAEVGEAVSCAERTDQQCRHHAARKARGAAGRSGRRRGDRRHESARADASHRGASAFAAKAASFDHRQCLIRPCVCSVEHHADVLRNQGRYSLLHTIAALSTARLHDRSPGIDSALCRH